MREVVVHGVYRHFKGNYYFVDGIAVHSETGERYVVYRQLYGERQLYIRPEEMFLSEADPARSGGQKYRFELVH